MKTLMLISALVTSACFSTFAQHPLKPIEPKTDIKVEKEFDENGNLIRYDSTYSSFYNYSSTNMKALDSLMNRFKSNIWSPFSSDFPSLNGFGNHLFHDFNDLFGNEFFNLHESMQKEFERMDSLRKWFYNSPPAQSHKQSYKL